MTHTTVESVLAQVELLTAQDRLLLVERLTLMLQRELPNALHNILSFAGTIDVTESITSITPATLQHKTDWLTFLKDTYGSLSETPIQRYEQGEYEEREPFI